MPEPDPRVTLDRRWRIVCARIERELRLREIVTWLSQRLRGPDG